MKSISTSLIISTYNWPEALNLCLLSIKSQTVLPDEIIIADDGSTNNTKQLIDSFRNVFNIPIVHIWQPDEGFQLSKIRNKAIATASREYIIQIDGDLILHPRFVSDHIEFSKKDAFTTGSRVLMNAQLSKRVLSESLVDIGVFSKGISNFINRIRSRSLRTYFGKNYKTNDVFYLRGCNMAFWRSDLIKVNGFNEDFVGWGREDNEIAIRLINSGIKKRSLKFGAIAYHIYHGEVNRESFPENERILLDAIKNKVTQCFKGLNQYKDGG